MAHRKVDIKSFRDEVMLNRNIIIAPSHYNYSLCTNYATRWFKDKFDIIDPNFFSYTHLDGSSAFAEFTRLSKQEMLVQSKDGKATLLKSVLKKDTSILPIHPAIIPEAQKVAKACPVKIIRVNEF